MDILFIQIQYVSFDYLSLVADLYFCFTMLFN